MNGSIFSKIILEEIKRTGVKHKQALETSASIRKVSESWVGR